MKLAADRDEFCRRTAPAAPDPPEAHKQGAEEA